MNIDDMLNALTPDVYRRFKRAVELRRWDNGEKLTQDQLDTCMQAIIAYEQKNLPPEERVGYISPKQQACADDIPAHTCEGQTREEPINWQDS